MAVWQYDLHLIPRERLIAFLQGGNARLDETTFDSVEWRGGVRRDLRRRFTEVFREGPRIEGQLLTWGTDDGNRVDVLLGEDGSARECFVRVDVRQLSATPLWQILELAREWDCLVVTERLDVLEPAAATVAEDLAQSRAARYVRDPHGYLTQLREPSTE